MTRKIITIERAHFTIITIISIIIPLTPYFIREGISLLEEEFVEMILIGALVAIGHIVMLIYKNEITRRQEEMDEMFRYIGEINVRLQHIRTLFTDINKYPENTKDFKRVLSLLAEKTLGIVNADWVLLRIIDAQTGKTLREHAEARQSDVVIHHEISNQDLLNKRNPTGCVAVSNNTDNVTSQTFCILPRTELTREQDTLLKAILSQLQMLFIIFTSRYYKNSSLELEQEKKS